MSYTPVLLDDIDSVGIHHFGGEEYEIVFEREEDDNYYFYTKNIDQLFDQLLESGEIEP